MDASPSQDWDRSPTGNRPVLAWRLWFPSVLFIVYLLCIGPAARLADYPGPIRDFCGIIYYPIGILSDHVPAADNILSWYIQLWDGRWHTD